jgi:hypothetical protein
MGERKVFGLANPLNTVGYSVHRMYADGSDPVPRLP